jgi:UDP-glucose 4-epimerase
VDLTAYRRSAVEGRRLRQLQSPLEKGIREVIASVARVGGESPSRDRREGAARLVASSAKARSELGFQPRFVNLDGIVETAWRFKERFPDGFPD